MAGGVLGMVAGVCAREYRKLLLLLLFAILVFSVVGSFVLGGWTNKVHGGGSGDVQSWWRFPWGSQTPREDAQRRGLEFPERSRWYNRKIGDLEVSNGGVELCGPGYYSFGTQGWVVAATVPFRRPWELHVVLWGGGVEAKEVGVRIQTLRGGQWLPMGKCKVRGEGNVVVLRCITRDGGGVSESQNSRPSRPPRPSERFRAGYVVSIPELEIEFPLCDGLPVPSRRLKSLDACFALPQPQASWGMGEVGVLAKGIAENLAHHALLGVERFYFHAPPPPSTTAAALLGKVVHRVKRLTSHLPISISAHSGARAGRERGVDSALWSLMRGEAAGDEKFNATKHPPSLHSISPSHSSTQAIAWTSCLVQHASASDWLLLLSPSRRIRCDASLSSPTTSVFSSPHSSTSPSSSSSSFSSSSSSSAEVATKLRVAPMRGRLSRLMETVQRYHRSAVVARASREVWIGEGLGNEERGSGENVGWGWEGWIGGGEGEVKEELVAHGLVRKSTSPLPGVVVAVKSNVVDLVDDSATPESVRSFPSTAYTPSSKSLRGSEAGEVGGIVSARDIVRLGGVRSAKDRCSVVSTFFSPSTSTSALPPPPPDPRASLELGTSFPSLPWDQPVDSEWSKLSEFYLPADQSTLESIIANEKRGGRG